MSLVFTLFGYRVNCVIPIQFLLLFGCLLDTVMYVKKNHVFESI